MTVAWARLREFRAVGSSQNCAFPMAMLNTCFADGMRALSDLLEGNCGMAAGRTQTNGPSHSSEGRRGGVGLRDACALMFEVTSADCDAACVHKLYWTAFVWC